MTIRQGYVSIFKVLDNYFSHTDKDAELRPLLSDMNPYAFKEGYSADPAVWEDWQQCVEKVCGKNSDIASAQLKPLLFTFLEMYREEWGYELDQVIRTLQNDPNLDSALHQYASQQEQP